MSGWSAFRLGMKRRELTVLAVGEWDRPAGGADWRLGADKAQRPTAGGRRLG